MYTGADGEEALWQLQQGILPNIIFLDLNMPRMNGKDCLTELKADKRFKNIPVVIFSTSSNDQEINQCISLGAQEYIVKPATFEELVQIVRACAAGNTYLP